MIDLGRLAWTSAPDIPWPAGWRGPVLVAAGIGAGWLLGSAVGDWWLFGRPGWSGGGKWLMSLLITVVASVLASVFLTSAARRATCGRIWHAPSDARPRQAAEAAGGAKLEPHTCCSTLANLRALMATDAPRPGHAGPPDRLPARHAGASRATLHHWRTRFAHAWRTTWR